MYAVIKIGIQGRMVGEMHAYGPFASKASAAKVADWHTQLPFWHAAIVPMTRVTEVRKDEAS